MVLKLIHPPFKHFPQGILANKRLILFSKIFFSPKPECSYRSFSHSIPTIKKHRNHSFRCFSYGLILVYLGQNTILVLTYYSSD